MDWCVADSIGSDWWVLAGLERPLLVRSGGYGTPSERSGRTGRYC